MAFYCGHFNVELAVFGRMRDELDIRVPIPFSVLHEEF